MYDLLYEYFILHKELSLPGIGTFSMLRKPAAMDFPNRKMEAPAYAVTLQYPALAPAPGLFAWLSKALQITDREAVMRFNDFAFQLKKQISDGERIDWQGVGQLNKGLAGEVKFIPAVKVITLEEGVSASKVIREKAEHMVKVGEDEKTSEEMTAFLNRPAGKRSYWWAWALVAGLVAIMFIGWHFSEQGVSVSACANQSRTVPDSSGATYQLVP